MKKYLIYIVLILVILIIWKWEYIKGLFVRSLPESVTTGLGLPGVPDNSGNIEQISSLDYSKTLRSGVQGPEVARLQTWLNMAGANPPLKVDGIFGSKTEKALMMATGLKVITLNGALAEIKKGAMSINPIFKIA